jgi:hypothetical protein
MTGGSCNVGFANSGDYATAVYGAAGSQVAQVGDAGSSNLISQVNPFAGGVVKGGNAVGVSDATVLSPSVYNSSAMAPLVGSVPLGGNVMNTTNVAQVGAPETQTGGRKRKGKKGGYGLTQVIVPAALFAANYMATPRGVDNVIPFRQSRRRRRGRKGSRRR